MSDNYLLSKELRKYGYSLKQIQRNEYAAIYSVTDIETGNEHGFEVFEIRIQQERTLPNGVHFAQKERYPSGEDFGKTAFAPRTIERAVQIFNELTDKAVNKAVNVVCATNRATMLQAA